MLVIDPSNNWRPLEERLETETNPTFRRQIEEVMFHIRVEAEGHIERAVGRLSPTHAEYRLYENGKPSITISGKDDIRTQFYGALVENIHQDLEWNIVRTVVDDGIVITEGTMKAAMRGSVLAAAGLDADPDTFYLSEGRHLVMWPFDDEGRLIGEHVYYGFTSDPADVIARPLTLEQIGTCTSYAPEPGQTVAAR
jgi:hypothetical protein